MSRKLKALFVLQDKPNVDNLGDRVIRDLLIQRLSKYGNVVITGSQFSLFKKFSSYVCIALALLSRRKVIYFAPPGSIDINQFKSTKAYDVKSKAERICPGQSLNVAIGRSNGPRSDPGWVERFDLVGIRDEFSLRHLSREYGEKVMYFPDLSFAIAKASGALGDIAKNRDVRQKEISVGLSFRASIVDVVDQEEYSISLVESVDLLIDSLKSFGITRISAFFQVSQDRDFVKTIAERYDLEFHDRKLEVGTYEPFYRNLDLVFSNRLHCLLLAAQSGALPVAMTIEDHRKIHSLYRSISFPDALFLNIGCRSEMMGDVNRLIQARLPLGVMVDQCLQTQRFHIDSAFSAMFEKLKLL